MKHGYCTILVVVNFAFSGAAFSSGCKMPNGKTWVNELGSTMSANIDSTGAITGTYTTAVGCGVGEKRAITGFCNGHAVTFSVNWGKCASTTAWSGTYDGGQLQTLWQLVLAKKPEWDSIVSGADTFLQK